MSIFDPYASILKRLSPFLVDSYVEDDPYGQGQGQDENSKNYAMGPSSSYMTPEYLLNKKKKKKRPGLFEQKSPSGLFEEVKKYGE